MAEVHTVRKMLILTVIILIACTGIALASWGVATLIRGDNEAKAPGALASAEVKGLSSAGPTAAQTAQHQGRDVPTAGGGGQAGEAAGTRSGVSTQYATPNDRYVTETQSHQNFFKALAEGRIRRLEVTSTDFQPAGDANSSYLYVIISTTDGARSDGTIVMKYSGGLWRIATVRLTGSLAGGTTYVVPSSFEADLARELQQQQNFLTKVAEGRLAYMSIDSVNTVGEGEVVLTGEVASKGGNTFPAEMRLRKDYDIWHMTNIVGL